MEANVYRSADPWKASRRTTTALRERASIHGPSEDGDRKHLEARLSRMRSRQLRELGDRHHVSLHGLTRKSDLIRALVESPIAPNLLVELGVDRDIPADEALEAVKDSDVDFARVEGLLEQARLRFEERRFESSIEAAQEAARLAERTTHQLRRSSWSYAILAAQGLLEPCDPSDPEVKRALDLLARAKDRFAKGSLRDETILQELARATHAVQEKESEAVRANLAAVRDSIREVANLGAAVAMPEDAWTQAADLLDRGDLRGAKEHLARASQLATEARERRVREIGEALSAVEDHIALARNVGADPSEAEAILGEAKAAAASREYGLAGELVKRAERLAMEGQQRQIRKAMELRQAQMERAYAVIAASEPVVQEAESYGLDIGEARVLLRQARDVAAKGDYLAGLTYARNAEEAALRLVSRISEERRRRGIAPPTSGICGVCQSGRLHFYDNGWGRCLDCSNSFRWRGPAGLWERFRGLLGT